MALQGKVQHSFIEVDCISILETAAEKRVALTRRIANIAHKKNLYDSSLIRHLYDIYSIYKKGHINDEFIPLVHEIVKDDQEIFKNVNTTYYTDPISEIKRAINELETNNSWQKNWDEFTNAMVFGKDVPSYQTVITVFSKLSQEIIQAN